MNLRKRTEKVYKNANLPFGYARRLLISNRPPASSSSRLSHTIHTAYASRSYESEHHIIAIIIMRTSTGPLLLAFAVFIAAASHIPVPHDGLSAVDGGSGLDGASRVTRCIGDGEPCQRAHASCCPGWQCRPANGSTVDVDPGVMSVSHPCVLSVYAPNRRTDILTCATRTRAPERAKSKYHHN